MNTLDTDWTDLHLPAERFLGHERYRTMVTPNGRGFSRFRDLALNPWSHDEVRGRTGLLIFLRDSGAGACWLCGEASGNDPASPASAAASLGVAQVRDVQHGIECQVDICVPPNADLELRRIALRNQGGTDRTIEVTTYLEVALHQPMAYASHPAFSKLFVQTEFLGAHHALLARRRPRGSTDASPFMVQALLGPGELQFETNRAAFIGRGYPVDCPRAFQSRHPLAGGIGNVLDPVFAMRRSVSVPAHGSVEMMVVLGGAETRGDAMALIQQRVDVGVFEAAARDAAIHEMKILQSLELTPEQALWHQALAGAMYWFDPRLGAAQDVRRRAAGHMGILWAHGLPTDSPLAVIDSKDEAEISHWANVQRYWRSHGLDTTLLLLTGEVSPAADAAADPAKGIVKLRRSDIPAAHLDVMLTVARLVAGPGLSVPSTDPTGLMEIKNKATSISPSASQKSSRPVLPHADKSALRFDNGHGGFSADGREYVIRLQATEHGLNLPPLPWVNVMANPKFGCLVSETGAGCTWSRNSHEWRLTPWSNDPVSDPHGEALYLRDEKTGRYWSPMPGPAASDCLVPDSASPYEMRVKGVLKDRVQAGLDAFQKAFGIDLGKAFADEALIPILPQKEGYGRYSRNKATQEPIEISLHDKPNATVTTVHEIAHHIDHRLLGKDKKQFSSATQDTPEMKALMTALNGTAAGRRLTAAVRANPSQKGKVPNYLRYLGKPYEIFARAVEAAVPHILGDATMSSQIGYRLNHLTRLTATELDRIIPLLRNVFGTISDSAAAPQEWTDEKWAQVLENVPDNLTDEESVQYLVSQGMSEAKAEEMIAAMTEEMATEPREV